MAIRELKADEVEFTLECLEEDCAIEGNVMASGDDAEDMKAERWVQRQLEAGNSWAWCTAKVTAAWNGFEGTDYLGCCSYRSEKDFRKPGGYFDDMKVEALANLNELLAKAGELCE